MKLPFSRVRATIRRGAKGIAILAATICVRTDPHRIGLLWRTRSGSNTLALARTVSLAEAAGFTVDLIKDGGEKSFRDALRDRRRIARCGILVSTHGPRSLRRRQYTVELWHGFPLKALGLLDAGLEVGKVRELRKRWARIDLIASYSPLYTTAMNACYPTTLDRYATTGLPRNDLLFRSDARDLLRDMLGITDRREKIVFHLPTYRDKLGSGPGANGNAFGFPNFEEGRFLGFLEKNRITFVHKLHPNDVARLQRNGDIRSTGTGRQRYFEEVWLEERGLDLYDCLGGIDALVTDYSSVYFDLLAVDVPFVFCPVDLDAYREGRNFLFEPYDSWTPGPKVVDQEGLESELAAVLATPERDRKARQNLRGIIHASPDGGAGERVWREILHRYTVARGMVAR